MFIDVTHGGDGRILRLSTSAIAYLDQAETGTRVRLIGGENLRIAESPAELEARIAVVEHAQQALLGEFAPTAIDLLEAVGRAVIANNVEPQPVRDFLQAKLKA